MPAAGALRIGLAAGGAVGALLLVAATFATVIEIRVGTTTALAGEETVFSGWDRHGPALALLAALAAVMLTGALRGSRAAALAVAAAGAAALAIALAWDAPDLDDTGTVGELYAEASAGAKAGWYLETLGGVLLLAAGGALLAAASGRGGRRQRPVAQRDPQRAGAGDDLAAAVDQR